MRVTRQKPQHFQYRPGQSAFGRYLLRKMAELFEIWQFAIEQKVCDLFETTFFRHVVDVVASIHQPRIRIDPANLGFTGDDSGQARAVSWFCFSSHKFAPSRCTVTNSRALTNPEFGGDDTFL